MTSRVKWLQKAIEKIQGIKAPKWFVDFMGEMQEAAIQAILKYSKDEIALIKAKIEEVAEKDIDGDDKFREVFSFCKAELKGKKDASLNTIINWIYMTVSGKF
jgi:hypothetical protein